MISLFYGEALGVNTNNDPHIGKVNFKHRKHRNGHRIKKTSLITDQNI